MSRARLLLLVLLIAACADERPAVRFHQEPPIDLSDWGMVFVEDETLRLNDRVLPYALNTPLFSDYARKLRTVWMPAGQAAHFSADEDWEFPVGTVLTKTFYYPRDAEGRVLAEGYHDEFDSRGLPLAGVRLMETRLLVRQAEGWEAYPYVWNEVQTEARLRRVGDMARLTLARGADEQSFNYVVPDANQCAGCHRPDHTSRALRPIGVKTRHLNRAFDYGVGTARNQLEAWTEAGYLRGASAPDAAPALARWDNPAAAATAQRARAYLDINCGHCHNPKGAADTSGLFLDIRTEDERRLGRCKPPVAAGRGSGGRRFSIVPGEPQHSILVYRMQTDDPGEAMPELGRALIHAEGVTLIREWIAQMSGDCYSGSAT